MLSFLLGKSAVVAFLASSAGRTTTTTTTTTMPRIFVPAASSARVRTFAGTSTSTTTSLSAASPPTTQYLLKYDYIPDVLEKRGPFREGHLGLARDLIAEGRCLGGGPTGLPQSESPPTGALFVFTDLEAAEKFVREDPYVSGGIVTKRTIEEWNVVVRKEL